MKKVLTLITILSIVCSAAVFSDSSVNFKGGRMVFGGGSSIDINFDDIESTNVRINPDIGIFAFDNFLLDFGGNFRFQNGNISVSLDSGVKYYFSGPVFVPSLGTSVSYTIVDDFYGNDNLLNMWASVGLDLFLMQSLSAFLEIASPVYYIYEDFSDLGSTIGVYFGFHFFVPAGPLEFTN